MKCLKTVKKLWGLEEWLVNSSKYCAKYLWIKPGYACSLHWHPIKEETFIVISGAVQLEIYPEVRGTSAEHVADPTIHLLETGDTYTITPNTPHRFRSVGYTAKGYTNVSIPTSSACVLEVSTTHDDSDVVRSVPSMKEDSTETVGLLKGVQTTGIPRRPGTGYGDEKDAGGV